MFLIFQNSLAKFLLGTRKHTCCGQLFSDIKTGTLTQRNCVTYDYTMKIICNKCLRTVISEQ